MEYMLRLNLNIINSHQGETMKNIITKTEGSVLSLTIDLAKSHGPSKSGKSIVIATTGGNKEIAPGIYMGLNIYKKV